MGRDIVLFSNDWDGDPLSKTHIARILARDNRILWVNRLGNRAPRANLHDAARLWRKAASFASDLREIREVERNLFVLSPLAVPSYGSIAVHALNRLLLKAQLMDALQNGQGLVEEQRHPGHCRLGMWQHGATHRPGDAGAFRELEGVHAQLHALACELGQLALDQGREAALSRLAEFDALNERLCHLIDQVAQAAHD